jgi:purine-binding chemotaxis protein CheW
MEESQCEKVPSPAQQYIVFRLGEILFGVEIRQMLHIVRMAPITRVPHAPHFLQGVINNRSQVVPVIDLHKRLALPATEHDKDARILIADLDGQPVGMLVDAVAGIWRLPTESIQPGAGTVDLVSSVYLAGTARYRNHLITLLDLGRVLTIQETDQPGAGQAQASGE